MPVSHGSRADPHEPPPPAAALAPSAASAPDGFRPDLEGLRAVAVVLVVAYHAGVPGFGGGYVGVDVFFVLSGFLITGLLLRELDRSGTISLPGFYARRARRLLPAALLVLAATIVASVAFLPPLQLTDVAGDVAAAALYVSNLRFAAQATNYLQAQLAPSPVLHFWSLGVEEQFYLFWPAIVLAVGRGGGRFGRRIGLTALAISAVSLALAIWLTTANEPWAFFSLPTRAWELGIGALLAVGARRLTPWGAAAGPRAPALARPLAGPLPGPLTAGLTAVLGWVGLGLIGLAAVSLSDATPFPGVVALLPTVGSALVVVAGFRAGRFAVGRPLGTAVPRFLGRISYSLYLWHWPLLVLPAAALGGTLAPAQRVALVGVAVVLAALTQRAVENPLRRGRLVGTLPRRNLALAGACSLVVAVASTGVGTATLASLAGRTTSAAADEAALDRIIARAATPAPSESVAGVTSSSSPQNQARSLLPNAAASTGSTPSAPAATDGPIPAGLVPSLADARSSLPQPDSDGCRVDIPGTQSPTCVYGNPSGRTTVVLFGDSHALDWWPALDRLATEHGWRFVSLTKSGCGTADVMQWIDSLKRAYTECSQWRAASEARIAAEHPALVVMSNSTAISIVQPDGSRLQGDAALPAWQAGLERTAARLTAIPGVKVAIVGDTPRSNVDVPVCLSRHQDSVLACATPYSQAVRPAWQAAAAAAATSGGATFIDPVPWVCPSRPCSPVIGNFLVYLDDQHLTSPFAAALAKFLGPELPIAAS